MAVYDALLFLMVVILISAGMFLYTANSASEGGDFSDAFYEDLARGQLVMVEALWVNGSFNDTHVGHVNASGGPDTGVLPLVNLTGTREAYTVEWAIHALLMLSAENEREGADWNLTPLAGMVESFFVRATLPGKHHAWLLLLENSTLVFQSDNVTAVEDLPEDRWAAESSYEPGYLCQPHVDVAYQGELRHYMWLA